MKKHCKHEFSSITFLCNYCGVDANKLILETHKQLNIGDTIKKEQFGKLWLEFQEYVKDFNAKALEKAKDKTSIQCIDEGIHTIGNGFDSFIAWCTGEYENS